MIVEVGLPPLSKTFTVHSHRLTARSRFFKSTTAKLWTSGRKEDRKIELPHDNPQDFENYLQCLYQGTLDYEEVDALGIDSLIRLYILADKLGDLHTVNMAIDQLIRLSDKTSEIPDGDSIALIFDNTPDTSPLRRLAVDFYLFEGSLEVYEELDDETPSAFSLAFMKRFRGVARCYFPGL